MPTRDRAKRHNQAVSNTVPVFITIANRLNSPSPDDKSSKMNVASAAAVVAASMIGAGVYTTSGYSLADLGSPHYVMAAWAVGGLIAICGAICYGALAKQFTESGGEYLFLARAVHPAAGMMAGWVSLLAGFTGAMAFAATAFASYTSEWAPERLGENASTAIAIGIVVWAAVIHSLGLNRGTLIQNVVVVLKLVLIGLFLLVSYSVVSDWQGVTPTEPIPAERVSAEPALGVEQDSADESVTAWQFALVFANALTWISLSYSGFNAAVYMTDEIKHPRRNVPRAMLMGTIGVTVLYLMLNAVFVYAPTATEVSGQGNVATAAAESIGALVLNRGFSWGAAVGGLVRIAILAGLATSVLALMQTGPRVYQKMAGDGFLPPWLMGSTVNDSDVSETGGGTSTQAALPAIWTQAALAIIVISASTLSEQLGYLGFTLSISAALCGGLVFLFRNHVDYPVRVWGYPLVPIVYVGGTLTIAALTAYRVPIQAAVGLGTLVIGALVYPVSRFLWGSRVAGDRRN